MNCEGSHDTEDWSNDDKFSFVNTEIMLKYVKIENSYLKLQWFHNISY